MNLQSEVSYLNGINLIWAEVNLMGFTNRRWHSEGLYGLKSTEDVKTFKWNSKEDWLSGKSSSLNKELNNLCDQMSHSNLYVYILEWPFSSSFDISKFILGQGILFCNS